MTKTQSLPPARPYPHASNNEVTALAQMLRQQIVQAGGWIGFDAFMATALYTPQLGYYTNASNKLGHMPASRHLNATAPHAAGSDFVTAPEMTPLFGRTLANQVAQALRISDTDTVWEFGAGSGALALQLLDTLGDAVGKYVIVDISEPLKARQRETLSKYQHKVRWVSQLPGQLRGVVLGNEILDAMPVQLLARVAGQWVERGVALHNQQFTWADRPTALRLPVEVDGAHNYLSEIHPQAEAFIRTLGERLEVGAAFFIDYGFPENEYYHTQRHMGTVMCHHAHQSDGNPLAHVGHKDITAHVNFTGIALTAQTAGLEVLGYTTQAHFLLNCGLAQHLEIADLAQRALAHKLIMEHEMGELFKVIGLCKGQAWPAMGFVHGDRTHRL